MSYMALYRKFRPVTFKDVKGQDHIVTTLKNQIIANRVGHAYLFCGTRGTGKTTLAKILGKAVNCENPIAGEPCGLCKSCKSISAGTSMNVIEIDAASNNGVDNIREIIEEVSYSPAEGKYKVYIIDEVHMLSIGAFNALLKTLEEPPAYVIFILATTESNKLPVTILSRCQRYDFKRITISTISKRLTELMNEENVEVEERAIEYISKVADGSMRDALSLLDQCIAFHYGKKLTYEMVLDVLGAVDTTVFSRVVNAVINKDVVTCIRILEDVVMQGRELTQFVSDFTWYLRNLLIAKTCDTPEYVIDMTSENIMQLIKEAEQLEIDSIMRYIRIFAELSGQLKYSNAKRVLLEIALIKLCKPEMETVEDSLLDRIRNLEEEMKNGVKVAVTDAKVIEEIKEKPKLDRAVPEDIKKLVANWEQVINRATQPLKNHLTKAQLSLGNDNSLLVVVEDGVTSDFFKNKMHVEQLEFLISEITGKEIPVIIEKVERKEDFEFSFVNLQQVISIDIEIED